MTMPNATIFDQLETAKIKTLNGPRWLASDLVRIFDLQWNYHLRPDANMRTLMTENKNRYLERFVTQVNQRRQHKISINTLSDQIISERTKTIMREYQPGNTDTPIMIPMDAMLDNFAAWTLLNPEEPINGGLFGRIYFMNLGDTYQNMVAQHNEFARIFMRRYLADTERKISGILHRHHIDFREFASMAHRAFYDNKDTETLKISHKIPLLKSDPIANYMGYPSLRAKFNAYTKTIQNFNSASTLYPVTTFIDMAMKNLGDERQKMYQHHNRTPEQDLYKLSVSRLNTKRMHEAVDFIAQHVRVKGH